jgi:hypothetical protein
MKTRKEAEAMRLIKFFWNLTPLCQFIDFLDETYWLSHCVSKEGMEVLTKNEQLKNLDK